MREKKIPAITAKFSIFIIMLMLMPSQVEAAGKNIKDKDITRAVEMKLEVSPVVSSHLIDVKTEQGVVELSGSVGSLRAKDRAVELAQSIVGVRSVVNRLGVIPITSSDKEIKNNIDTALMEDPATDLYEIEVSVKDGIAVLSGTVDSFAEKELAGQVAKGIKGLKALQNMINVDVKLERSDFEIEEDIRKRYLSDVYIDPVFIDIRVKNGKVTLSGTVGSSLEKRRAIYDAYVAGVKSVDGVLLDVQWWAKDPMEKKTEKDLYPSDEKMGVSVKDALLYDPRVKLFNIDVEVEAGKAILTGVVDNLKAKRAAAQDARNTLGIWGVENNLKVRPSGEFMDEVIRTKIIEAFDRDYALDKYDFIVNIINQKAYLYGNVDSIYHKNRAEDLASRVPGVVDVENYVVVNALEKWKSDGDILNDVEEQLFWSPYVDSEDLKVSVDDGKVTIKGIATDWSEADAAVKNAFDGGAKSVKADITLSSGNKYDYYYDSYESYNLPYYGYYPYFGTIGYGIPF